MKIHHEGTSFLVAAGIFLSFLCLYVYLVVEQRWPFWLAVVVSVVLLGIAFNFYRSPHRIHGKPTNGLVLASADGHIVAIEEVDEPEVLGGKCLMISTFMSLFNVHAQWVPVAGEVTYVRHHRGNVYAAYVPKSSTENERSTVEIVTPEGHHIVVRQIAGAMARRIETYLREGERCEIDDQLGFIKLGSRVDIFLPLGSKPLVDLDEPVTGNVTVLAELPLHQSCK